MQHGENMQISQKKAVPETNSGPSCCEATVLTIEQGRTNLIKYQIAIIWTDIEIVIQFLILEKIIILTSLLSFSLTNSHSCDFCRDRYQIKMFSEECEV